MAAEFTDVRVATRQMSPLIAAPFVTTPLEHHRVPPSSTISAHLPNAPGMKQTITICGWGFRNSTGNRKSLYHEKFKALILALLSVADVVFPANGCRRCRDVVWLYVTSSIPVVPEDLMVLL